MRITGKHIQMIVEHALAEHASGERMYRCFHGSLVPYGSQECIEDITKRMEDAKATRDECDNRTDKRDYYNGVLKVLRRELRDAQKVNGLKLAAAAQAMLDEE